MTPPAIGMMPSSRGLLLGGTRQPIVVSLIRVVNTTSEVAQVWLCLTREDNPFVEIPVWPWPVRLGPLAMAQDNTVLDLDNVLRIEGWSDKSVSYVILGKVGR